jgi:hypothetical protein
MSPVANTLLGLWCTGYIPQEDKGWNSSKGPWTFSKHMNVGGQLSPIQETVRRELAATLGFDPHDHDQLE